MTRTGKSRGFTLIELLVVIAIIALLMSILVPTLQRVRKQSRAVACQSTLRQWGILWATYTAENDGHLPNYRDRPPEDGDPWWGGWGWWGWGWWGPWGADPERRKSQWYQTTKDIMLCPMASKPANTTDRGDPAGGTFLAWGWGGRPSDRWYGYGSYGVNEWVHWWYWGDSEWRKFGWSTTDVTNAAATPVFLDSAWPWSGFYGWRSDAMPPPEFDAIPTMQAPGPYPSCINRHDGYVNGLFLDWSVRKVGLKELWTLQWHKQYNTQGPYTKAGGVKPDDWPAWMQRFEDY